MGKGVIIMKGNERDPKGKARRVEKWQARPDLNAMSSNAVFNVEVDARGRVTNHGFDPDPIGRAPLIREALEDPLETETCGNDIHRIKEVTFMTDRLIDRRTEDATKQEAARTTILSSLEAAGLTMDLSGTRDDLEIPKIGKDTTRTVTLDGEKVEIDVRPLMGVFSRGGPIVYFMPLSGEILSRILSIPRNPNQGVIFRNS